MGGDGNKPDKAKTADAMGTTTPQHHSESENTTSIEPEQTQFNCLTDRLVQLDKSTRSTVLALRTQ